MGKPFSITLGGSKALIAGIAIVIVSSAIIAAMIALLVYLDGDGLCEAMQAILYMLIPLGFGFSLIGVGIKGIWNRRTGRYYDPERYKDGGEFRVPLYEGKYHIVCRDCGARNAIPDPERSFEGGCRDCGSAIRTIRKKNRTFQDRWNESRNPCPKCRKEILTANSITPLYVVCPSCKAKIRLKDADEKERPIKEGFMECPKCTKGIDLSMKERDELKCPYCGVRMRFKE